MWIPQASALTTELICDIAKLDEMYFASNYFDLYRLEDAEELEDIDFYGVLESGGVSLVEWGDKFPDAMPDEYLDVRIAVDGDDVRHLTATGQGDAGQRLEEAFAQRG